MPKLVNNGSGDLVGAMQIDNGFGVGMDPGLWKPYWAPRKSDGKLIKVCTLNTGRSETRKDKEGRVVTNKYGTTIEDPITEVVEVSDIIDNCPDAPVEVLNATTLSKDQWVRFDTRVQVAARKRLSVWGDLMSRVPYGALDGMSSSLIQYETLTDDGTAYVDMDGTTEGTDDESHFQLEGLPLPLTHSDFALKKRFLKISRKSGTPVDTTRAEQAARRVAETVEKTALGTITGLTYGDGASYGATPVVSGFTNHAQRVTKSDLTASASTTGATFVSEVEAMITLLEAADLYGPYVCYVGRGYRGTLRKDYKATEASSTITTRERLLEFDEISEVKTPDFLTGDVVVLVRMDEDTIEAVNGMDIQTLQWENHPMKINYKVVAIYVPFIKRRSGGSVGICHGTTS